MCMYAKIFASMYDGTLATVGPWEALVTFQQLLVLADRFGDVDMTAEAISRRTTIPLELINRGIAELEKPDERSRRPDFDGRRIVRLAEHRDWGWHIVNHEHYRQIRSAEERREYHRAYMAQRRADDRAKRKSNGAGSHDEPPDESPVVERIPIIGGAEWEVRQSFVDELDRLYPRVDPQQTLREIRGWCLGNPSNLKTPRGVRKFIVGWFAREQDRHGRAP